jgi:hypothetical protein
MTVPYIGELGAFGLKKETTLGTFVAPTTFIPVMLPLNFGSPDIALLEAKGIYSRPDMVNKVAQGAGLFKSIKGKFEVEPENCGDIIMAAFGTDTLSGPTNTSVYTHTFTRLAAAQLPTYSLWSDHGINYPQAAGCMLNKFDIEVKAPDYVVMDFDFVGSKYQSGGVTHSPSYSSLAPFKFDQAVLTVGGSGVTLYSDLKISIDNMVKADPVLGSSIYSNVIYSAGMKVSIAATIVVEDTTEWTNFINGTASSFTVALTSTTNIPSSSPGTPYSLTITIPTANYSAAPFPLKSGKLEITFQAVGVYTTGSTKTISAALVNSVSSAY